MTFEKKITNCCKFYKDKKLAVIYKRPSPITIVDSISNTNMYKACFSKKSTTDFVGVFKSMYVDFECKNTRQKSFPISMIPYHQINHLIRCSNCGGKTFVLVNFEEYDEVFLLNVSSLLEAIKLNNSLISHQWFLENCQMLNKMYQPDLNLLDIIEREYLYLST